MKVNLNDSYTSVLIVLKMCGVLPSENYYNKLYRILMCTSMILFTITSSVYVILNIQNLEEIASVSHITLSCTSSLSKIFIFNKNWAQIKEIFQDLSSDTFQPKNEQHRIILKRGIQISKLITAVLNIAGCCCLIMYAFVPIVARKRILPYKSWVPYDLSSYSMLYYGTYLWQGSIAVPGLCFSTLSMDCLFAIIMIQISLQCRMICEKTENLDSTPHLKQDLLDCIMHHQEIVK